MHDIYSLRDFQTACHEQARQSGFWDGPQNMGEKIALMHSELSEALEGLRKGDPPDEHCPSFSSATIELADCLIRIFDFCEHFGLDLTSALLAKHKFNGTREKKHGKRF